MHVSATQAAWLVCLSVAAHASAEVFSYRNDAEHFEAVVSADRVVVKERYQGASAIYGDLSCPLGPAVRASILPAADSKLCLTFAKDRCVYTRYQNGEPIHKEELAAARVPRMCLALANAQDAQRLVSLVNAGQQQTQHGSPAPLAQAASAAPASAALATGATSSEPIRQAPRVVVPHEPQTSATAGQRVGQSVRRESASTAPAAVRAEVRNVQSNAAAPVTLFIHVRNAAQREQAERLIEPLAASGVRVTGIKLMAEGPASTDLRYFHTDDARHSGRLVRVLLKLGLSRMQVKRIRGFESRATPGQYELWLSPRTGALAAPEHLRPRQAQTAFAGN